jgi:16S rRNA (guanine527-N7)-methyltransferase
MAGLDDSAGALAALRPPAHAVQPLRAYLHCLDSWAARINLTGALPGRERVDLLVAGVVPLAAHLQPGRVLDIGSGNGSPGLVLAALRPELTVVLLEPRQRRWAFLRDAARAMGRGDIEVLRLRHDQYQGPPAANLVARAVALPLLDLAPLVASGGQVILIGRQAESEGSGFEPADPLGGAAFRYRRCST